MLIVEDGSIIAGAESYCTVAFADARLGNRGFTIWTNLTATEKEQALRRATDYMGQSYRASWLGCRVSSLQVLDFPRSGVTVDTFPVSVTIVPLDIQNACAELAIRAASGELDADLSQGVISETVGELSVTYDRNSSRTKKYSAVENLLRPYLQSGGVSHNVVRT